MALGRIDHFTVLRPLGHGGMSDVYLAHDQHLDCEVALKVLREERASDPAQRSRLLAEARALAKVDHANIVGVLACGEARPEPPDFLWPGTPGPHPVSVVYIAMRHVEGTDLRTRLQQGPIPLGLAVDWARQILRGLEAAHAHGVVHRDLSPRNIRVTPSGELKILDFGLAGQHHEAFHSSGRTKTASHGHIFGTVGYASPEQSDSSGHADPRSDLFSVGVILFEMVTGRRPFPGSTIFAVLSAIAAEDAPPLRRFVDHVPAELERITSKLLQRDPRLRYQSAHEALTDLDALALAGSSSGTHRRLSLREQMVAWLPTRRLRVAAAALVLTLVLIGLPNILDNLIPRPRTLVVTAIVNKTGKAHMDLVVAGLTQDLLITLAQSSRVNVVESRLMKQGEPILDPKMLGREYGASFVLYSSLHEKTGDDGLSKLALSVSEVRVRDQVTHWARQWEVGPQGIAELRRQLLQNSLAHWPQAQGAAAGTRGAIEVRPAAADEAYLRALGLIKSVHPASRDSSIAEFDRALDLDPSFARAYAGRARGQLARFILTRDTTTLSRGEADARRAIELAPDEAEGHMALAQILQHRGRTKEAVAELQGVVETNDYNAEVFKLLGEAHAKLGDIPSARRSYKAALEIQPAGPRVWRSYGNFLWQKAGDLAGAEYAYRRELELSPDDNQGYEDLAVALILQCRYVEALAEYEKRPVPQVPSGTLYANRGTARYLTGDYTGALSDFLEGVKLSPENGKRRLSLGDVYMKLGRRDEAANEYRQARRMFERELVNQPDDVWLRATYAMTLAKVGDFERALVEVERCETSRLERHVDALHDVAKTLALCGERERTMRTLQMLVDAGFARCLLRVEDEFASLQGEPRFRKLMATAVD